MIFYVLFQVSYKKKWRISKYQLPFERFLKFCTKRIQNQRFPSIVSKRIQNQIFPKFKCTSIKFMAICTNFGFLITAYLNNWIWTCFFSVVEFYEDRFMNKNLLNFLKLSFFLCFVLIKFCQMFSIHILSPLNCLSCVCNLFIEHLFYKS